LFANIQGKSKSQVKSVLKCGQLPRVLFLTQNLQERSSLLDKVLHIKHSVVIEYTGFPRLLESPGFFSWKFQDLESPGKALWSWKVMEIEA